MTTTEFTAAAKRNGTVDHNGQILALEQMAFVDSDPRNTSRTVYRAMAQDPAGNRFAVQWALKPAIEALPTEDRPDDESEYCDWSAPERIDLIEEA